MKALAIQTNLNPEFELCDLSIQEIEEMVSLPLDENQYYIAIHKGNMGKDTLPFEFKVLDSQTLLYSFKSLFYVIKVNESGKIINITDDDKIVFNKILFYRQENLVEFQHRLISFEIKTLEREKGKVAAADKIKVAVKRMNKPLKIEESLNIYNGFRKLMSLTNQSVDAIPFAGNIHMLVNDDAITESKPLNFITFYKKEPVENILDHVVFAKHDFSQGKYVNLSITEQNILTSCFFNYEGKEYFDVESYLEQMKNHIKE